MLIGRAGIASIDARASGGNTQTVVEMAHICPVRDVFVFQGFTSNPPMTRTQKVEEIGIQRGRQPSACTAWNITCGRVRLKICR